MRMALATVVHVEDSSYRRSGARMLIAEDGTWTGGISGGCLEGDTLLKAKHVINEQRPIVIRYDTREDDPNQIGVGLGCNGLIDVLITPITDDHNPIEKLRSITDTRTPIVAVTVVNSQSDTLPTGLFSLDCSVESILEELTDVRSSRKSKTIDIKLADGSESRLFLEYIAPTIRLCIFGKNYDTIPLARIAKEVGWHVTIIANKMKVSKELYASADQVHDPRSGIPSLDDHTVCLLMAHDYRTDLNNLLQLHDQGLPYVGLLGPRKRYEKMLREIGPANINEENVFAPIGLDTGATSPEEISISIIAEIRAHLSKRNGGYLRERKERINA